MSKQLFDYAKKIAKETWVGCHGCDENDENMRNTGFLEGFNSAISLELPIKFAEWIREESDELKDFRRTLYGIVADKDMDSHFYKYWINNILKLE